MQVNPRQLPLTLPDNRQATTVWILSVFQTVQARQISLSSFSTGASYDAYYVYDTSNNSLFIRVRKEIIALNDYNAANTSRTFTPGATFNDLRIYKGLQHLSDLGEVVVENAYYETGTAGSARLLTMVTSLMLKSLTSGSGRGLTNNDVDFLAYPLSNQDWRAFDSPSGSGGTPGHNGLEPQTTDRCSTFWCNQIFTTIARINGNGH